MLTPPGDRPGSSLRLWQKDALRAWEQAGRRGIVAAATGTGKTWFAIAALQGVDLATTRVVIVVPTKVLQTQWVEVLETRARLGSKHVGLIGGDDPNFKLSHSVVVAVLSSARDRIPGLAAHWQAEGKRVFLIVDECHAAGTYSTSDTLFSVSFDLTLGLSATPERGDDGLDDVLVPNIGPVIYRYPLRQALDDGALAPLTMWNVFIQLAETELHEYLAMERRLKELSRDPALADRIRRLESEQRALLARAGGRVRALERLMSGGLIEGRRTLIFHESIAQARATSDVLTRLVIPHVIEHSKEPRDARVRALRRFSNGGVGVLVTVRTVDEGVDVPAANTAIIVSGTTNARQRIQRVGRVVRPAGGEAFVVSLLAAGTTEELVVGERDPELLGTSRVREVRGVSPQDLAVVSRQIRMHLGSST